MPQSQYFSLPQEDKPLIDGEHDHSKEPEPATQDRLHRLVYWAIVLISACCLIDVVALLYFASQNTFHRPIPVDELPLRSTYIGLENLYLKKNHKSHKIAPIVNLPKVLQVVDSAQPGTVFPQFEETWATPHGIVPVNNRRLLVTRTASTVAQFRILDFGMDHCVIELAVPAPANDTSATVLADGQPKGQVEVWSLKEDKKMDSLRLSSKTKPARDRLLGTLSPSYGGTVALDGFSCVSGTYLTVEMACGNQDCFFESVARQKSTEGLYLQQHQTV
ncbi:hypothetical protein C8J57DRAFT_1712274 [Mycena rebaudengoi]|nr:hypothetical protein C8J57DRAFT_1712274 [Mycena rebaudengoi]